MGYRTWEVGSKFGKPEKGVKKTETLKSEGDQKIEVLYRDITNTSNSPIHVGYDPNFEWVEKVAKDIA